MNVIPRPPKTEKRPTYVTGKLEPLFHGEGGAKGVTSYACGRCDFTLVANVHEGSMWGGILGCPSCGAFNEFPPRTPQAKGPASQA